MSIRTGPLPLILEQPRIPPPLHGVNPRSLMGKSAWDDLRREVYARHGYRCAACGVPSRQALFRPYLEAHERYEIDYAARRMSLTAIEPLCNACHQFVHPGLMGHRINSRSLKIETAKQIMNHGIAVLRAASGTVPAMAHQLCNYLRISHGLKVAPGRADSQWSGWHLLWNGTSYPSPYRNEAEWRKSMNERG